eukprot:TRINITY_DN13090_c3_g1_i2.p1 TRINITY_DN13090_c3_g1~~TRINITY_DN13090_c3_g1_i2.p1  ORF type:complete len:541 (+),score=96.75 TRINITY_DN13090_c3_g1_i2:94-1716(+)
MPPTSAVIEGSLAGAARSATSTSSNPSWPRQQRFRSPPREAAPTGQGATNGLRRHGGSSRSSALSPRPGSGFTSLAATASAISAAPGYAQATALTAAHAALQRQRFLEVAFGDGPPRAPAWQMPGHEFQPSSVAPLHSPRGYRESSLQTAGYPSSNVERSSPSRPRPTRHAPTAAAATTATSTVAASSSAAASTTTTTTTTTTASTSTNAHGSTAAQYSPRQQVSAALSAAISSSSHQVPLRRSIHNVTAGNRGLSPTSVSLVAAARASSGLASTGYVGGPWQSSPFVRRQTLQRQGHRVRSQSPVNRVENSSDVPRLDWRSVSAYAQGQYSNRIGRTESPEPEPSNGPPARDAPEVSASAAVAQTFSGLLKSVEDFGSDGGNCCSICLGTDVNDITELRCGNQHRFHKSCITTWMVASMALEGGMPRCPLCRKRLSAPDIGSVRRDVLDLSLQELTAVERLLDEVRHAVLEQRFVISSAPSPDSETTDQGPAYPELPWTQLRAAQDRAVMLEDRVTELRSAVLELQTRLSLRGRLFPES